MSWDIGEKLSRKLANMLMLEEFQICGTGKLNIESTKPKARSTPNKIKNRLNWGTFKMVEE